MKGVNLIPARRVHARKRAARVRLWLSVLPTVVSLLLGAYGWLRTTWTTDTTSVVAAMGELDAAIQAAESAGARARTEAARQQVILRAHKAVGEQPNWGVLLHLLSQHVGEQIVFSGCTLEPVAASGKVEKGKDNGRPERFRLTLHGMGRSQPDVSAFVIALEKEHGGELFDSISLMESRRVPLAGRDAISFRIECTLTDSVAEVK